MLRLYLKSPQVCRRSCQGSCDVSFVDELPSTRVPYSSSVTEPVRDSVAASASLHALLSVKFCSAFCTASEGEGWHPEVALSKH